MAQFSDMATSCLSAECKLAWDSYIHVVREPIIRHEPMREVCLGFSSFLLH